MGVGTNELRNNLQQVRHREDPVSTAIKLIKQLYKGASKWEAIPEEFKTLIEKMLKVDPKERISMHQVRDSPFLRRTAGVPPGPGPIRSP